MRFVHFGIYDKISEKYFQNVKNENGFVKPLFGGLWASPYEENETTEWENFVKEIFGDSSHPMNYKIIFELKENSKIYTINSYIDLLRLLKNYTLKTEIDFKRQRFIDFEKMSKDYDGLLLTSNGQIETRFSFPGLYGWDVESLLLFNIKCIQNQTSIQLEKDEEKNKEHP